MANLFEFVRNDDFNARNFFQSSVPEYRKNDFGYTLGGPVYIPGVYNKNKDKTFFFFSEEWRRDMVPGQTFSQQVPSDVASSREISRMSARGPALRLTKLASRIARLIRKPAPISRTTLSPSIRTPRQS